MWEVKEACLILVDNETSRNKKGPNPWREKDGDTTKTLDLTGTCLDGSRRINNFYSKKENALVTVEEHPR